MIFATYICRIKQQIEMNNKQFTYEPKHAQINLRGDSEWYGV
jgi:hypothetical protein